MIRARHIEHRHAVALLIAFTAALSCRGPEPQSAPAADKTTFAWWHDAVFYEVFVRSFADSDGDGVGDLRGLTAKLDYLNDGKTGGDDLGINALWLMPINASPSYHGYDVTDYRAVNPQYGTLADFEALVQAAHARGVRIIVDFVINHSSVEHPWFQAARTDAASPQRDYYVWSPTPLPWERPWDKATVWHPAGASYYYGLFGDNMPDLNLRNPRVEAEMLDIMRTWLARGVDGFRVDAARHLFESTGGVLTDQPETFEFVARLRAALQEQYPDVLLIAEAWTGHEVLAPYDDGRGFQMAFDFELSEAIAKGLGEGNATAITAAVTSRNTRFRHPEFTAPFLTNHDMARVMRALDGDVRKAKVAAALLLSMPGSPFLYYGEELGMMGGAGPRDEDKRTPMRWDGTPPQHGFTTATQSWYGAAGEATGTDVASALGDETSLLNVYQRLIALRHGQAALSFGRAHTERLPSDPPALLRLHRALEGEAGVMLVANVGAESVVANCATLDGRPLMNENAQRSTDGTCTLGAYGFLVTGYVTSPEQRCPR